MKKVLLEGYYNQGNFGDDLLMVVAINFLKELHVDFKMHDKDLCFFNSYICEAAIGNEDLIVKGGGGLFFDFNENASFKEIILSRLFSFAVVRKLAYYKLKKN